MYDTFYIFIHFIERLGSRPRTALSLSTLSRLYAFYLLIIMVCVFFSVRSFFLSSQNQCKLAKLFYDFTPKIDNRNRNLAHENKKKIHDYYFVLSMNMLKIACIISSFRWSQRWPECMIIMRENEPANTQRERNFRIRSVVKCVVVVILFAQIYISVSHLDFTGFCKFKSS